MKKVLCVFVTVIMLLSCMTACNFHSNFNDGIGNTKFDALPQIEKMLAALTSGDTDAALALMHPDVREQAGYAVAQTSEYLRGRNVVSLETINRSVYTSKGSAGDIRQESGALRVTMDQARTVAISVVYLTTDAGEGFSSFQVVLGTV